MNDNEWYLKTKEILSKFPDDVNMNERMQKSALFNRVVQTLVRDEDPYKLISDLINVAEDTQNAFKHHLLQCPEPFLSHVKRG